MFTKSKIAIADHLGRLNDFRQYVSVGKGLAIHTPDYPALEMKKYHFVFLCDEHMSGHRDHEIVHGLNTHPCYTKDEYVLLKKELGKFSRPVLLDGENMPEGPALRRVKTCHKAPVAGQLFLLAPYVIAELDIHKQNGLQFHRREVSIVIPHGFIIKQDFAKPKRVFTKETVIAWAYFADHEYYHDITNLIRFKDSLLKTRPKNADYIPRYHFTRHDI